MSKKVLFALLFGYFFRAFQKGPIWIGAKAGMKKSFMKIMRDEFPDLTEEALGQFPKAQQESMRTKLRGL